MAAEPALPSYHHVLETGTQSPIDPRVRHITIDSLALGVTKHFYVALPPGYNSASSAGARYPVLYLFRGHEHEWVHRWQDKSRRGRTVVDVYRDLLEEGNTGPMILVFPGISSDDNRVPGLLVNFRAPRLAHDAPGVGSGRFEDYFIRELIPCVDDMFRTIADRSGRAVDGFSLGGFQAIRIAAACPDLFCSAGSFDGTFLYSANQGKTLRTGDRVLRNPMFAPAFGWPPDHDFISSVNPANILLRSERQALASVQWMIRSGPEAAEPWQSNYYRAQHVIKILKVRKLENNVPDVLSKARHSWHWADKHVAGTLPLHWRAMQASRLNQERGA